MAASTIAVTKLFRIDEKEQILAHVSSFDWDFAPADVLLVCGGETLRVRQIGSGNHEGHAVIVLRPDGPWSDAAACAGRMQVSTEEIRIKR